MGPEHEHELWKLYEHPSKALVDADAVGFSFFHLFLFFGALWALLYSLCRVYNINFHYFLQMLVAHSTTAPNVSGRLQ